MLEDLRRMRANVSNKVKVKAAGRVRTLPALLNVLDESCDALRRDRNDYL